MITNPSVCTEEGVGSNTQPAVPSAVVKTKEGFEDTDGRKDLLFFMRDRTSQTELQSVSY